MSVACPMRLGIWSIVGNAEPQTSLDFGTSFLHTCRPACRKPRSRSTDAWSSPCCRCRLDADFAAQSWCTVIHSKGSQLFFSLYPFQATNKLFDYTQCVRRCWVCQQSWHTGEFRCQCRASRISWTSLMWLSSTAASVSAGQSGSSASDDGCVSCCKGLVSAPPSSSTSVIKNFTGGALAPSARTVNS